MYILFLDDSCQRKDRYVGLGGVAFHDQYLFQVAKRFNAIKKKYSIPPIEEIKWSPKRSSWIYKNLRGVRRFQVYSLILRLINRFRGTVFVSVGSPYTDSRQRVKTQIILNNIENLLERFEMFLKTQNEYGIIIADHERCHKDNKKLLEHFYEMQMTGTRYIIPRMIPLNLLTAPSHQVPFLQIADLIVGITVAMISGMDEYAKQYFPIIKDTFYRRKNGEIAGYGLKLFPNRLKERYGILNTNY